MATNPSSTRPGAVCFLVEADASPGLLPRLLQPFAKRDLTPDHLWFHRIGETVQVGIALHAVDAGIAHLIEGNLRQVIGVFGLSRTQPGMLRDIA